MMNATCPCCGHPVGSDRLLVDLNSNRASRRGSMAQLARQEAEAAFILADRSPRLVPWGDLADGIYGPSHDRDLSTSTFYALISSLRHKLKPLGVSIENTMGQGWRIVLDA